MSTPRRWGSSRELLDFLLLEKTPSEPDVLALLDDLDEDHLLDFKSGKAPPEDLKVFLREYLAGFANVNGGVLVVGVTDKRPRQVDGVPPQGAADLASWAAAVVRDIAARISPAPVFKTVTCSGNQVLLMATERAPQLIPLVEKQRFRYPLRVGSHLIRDPQPDIITDLTVGRRAQPAFRVPNVHFGVFGDRTAHDPSRFPLTFDCIVENDSFVQVRNLAIGLVGYTVPPPFFVRLSEKLLQQVHDPGRPAAFYGPHGASDKWTVRQAQSETVPLLPVFAWHLFVAPTDGPLLFLPIDPNHAILDVALYVLAEGAPPDWYQVTYEYFVTAEGPAGYNLSGKPNITRLSGARPTIGWRPF